MMGGRIKASTMNRSFSREFKATRKWGDNSWDVLNSWEQYMENGKLNKINRLRKTSSMHSHVSIPLS